MALLHRAELRPTKLELLSAWLPGRPWFQGPATGLERVAAYRFDDPDGEVGIETMLVRAAEDGPVYQVPLTYRGAPLPDSTFLIGTMEHSVLGPRWAYDACGDVVYLAALAGAILGGTAQADEFFEVDGRKEVRERSMTISGGDGGQAPALGRLLSIVDGDPARIVTDSVEFEVHRLLGKGGGSGEGGHLTGTWPGQAEPFLLASASVR